MELFLCLCFKSVMLSCLFIAALWPLAGKNLTSWLLLYLTFYFFSYVPMWCPGSGKVLDCIDS